MAAGQALGYTGASFSDDTEPDWSATTQRCVLQVSRDKLISLGTCLGKFTHSGKFRLTIGCLDILAAHAKYKVCWTVQHAL